MIEFSHEPNDGKSLKEQGHGQSLFISDNCLIPTENFLNLSAKIGFSLTPPQKKIPH